MQLNDIGNIIKKININKVVSNTNKTLKTIKKAIPLYKEVKPYINKEKRMFDKKEIIKKEEKKEDREYNDSLTFFQ